MADADSKASNPVDEANPAVAWGFVGTGEVSRYLAPDFAALPTTRRRAVASRSIDRARAFADEFGFERAYGTVDELLADGTVDAVYVATPHATHRDIALRALEAGKNVLVEKPLGVNEAEARDIASAARAAGRFAMEAMWMKFTPVYRRLLDEIRDGTIGTLRSVRASFGFPFPPGSGSRWSAELRGSALLDQGIYPVTLAYELLGPPDRIVAGGTVRPDGIDLSEHVTFTYDDGRYAQLAASMVEFIEPTASLHGTEGWIHVPWPFWGASRFEVRRMTAPETLLSPHTVDMGQEGHGFVPMIRAVNASILRGDLEQETHPMSAAIAVFGVLDRIRSLLDQPPLAQTTYPSEKHL
ncbi:Gfo/Idh/MocA family oxidoreductase [Acrocarpospora macrocephala]|uniref:Putative oxidoreductase n=1 Tax=Acrocarpospora macrocephala TaxID=150177 RepID=A0A5M3WW33_9ACTN|nr:Gfo/Idh/MocA family oxidoreductase [Acrocarpospora macrocephala]GES12606.1 putative oxidoreductase [Acrocarpospora macrocephala]